MSSTYNSQLGSLAATPALVQQDRTARQSQGGTWFEAMARAWGEALDNQANTIQEQSEALTAGGDTPAAITELSAQSVKMGFLANSSQTSISSVGTALETMARKQ